MSRKENERKGKVMIKKLTKWMPIPLILSKSENF